MDHAEVVRQKLTEQYLLHELDSQQRDEFEEHFFDCRVCALDLRLASTFIEQSKSLLAEPTDTTAVAVRIPVPVETAGRFAWLRPALAVPALAFLLIIVAYQNLVTYPRLEQALNRPQILPWASLNTRTRGGSSPVITVPRGRSFLLFVNIPPDNLYVRYIADLYNPAGKLEWSLTFPAASAQDQWPVQVPGADREAGTYTLTVRGVTATGESKEVGRTSLELQIQK